MKFGIMGYETQVEWAEVPTQEEHLRRMHNHQNNLNQITLQRGIIGRQEFAFSSTGLPEPASRAITVRLDAGDARAMDGPYAETKEVLAGFDVIGFESVDGAIEFGKKLFDHPGHTTEIRPVQDVWWVQNRGSRSGGARFLFTVLVDESKWARLSDAERERTRRHRENTAMSYPVAALENQDPVCLSAVEFRPGAEWTTLREKNGAIVATPGPALALPHVTAAMIQMDCTSQAAAVEWARKFLLHDFEVVEIRACGGWFIYHG
jgi:hypothetical protein